jgi:L-ascorbate metabolism protein UlaG (beta-lactamase superfamily)
MNELDIDVMLIPVSGTYVMTPEEAAQAAGRIKPDLAIPMHFGTIIGSRSDAEKFKDLAECKVEILDKED